MTRFLVVTNSSAGTADDENVGAAVDVLRSAGDVRVGECARPEELPGVLAGREDRRVVLVGGDGSVHAAVAVLHARGELTAELPLGLLPLGTGNDLARSLGIPLDPAAAAQALLSGRPRPLDLLVDDEGGIVVNAVHLGIGAEAAEQAGALKDRLGKAAYAVGSAVAGVGETGWSVTVEVDGEVVQGDDEPVLLVGVCNARSVGGGALLAPDASPDDGLLDVVVATSTGPLARLGFGVAMRSGEHVERDDVLTVRGRRATVRGEPFPVNADGELAGPVPARTWTVHPRAWSLVVPPS